MIQIQHSPLPIIGDGFFLSQKLEKSRKKRLEYFQINFKYDVIEVAFHNQLKVIKQSPKFSNRVLTGIVRLFH